MPLLAPINPITKRPHRERILAYSQTGAGKSSTWLQIARVAQSTGTDTMLYVLDTDATVEPLLYDNPELAPIISYHPVVEWEEIRDETRIFAGQYHDQVFVPGKARRGDWIVVDMAHKPWKEVQNHFTRRAHGIDDAGEYALALRAAWDPKKDKKAKGSVDGWDWGYVNRMYDDWAKSILFGSEAHVLMLAPEDPVDKNKEENRAILDMYGDVGAKPRGVQKDLAYSVDTILRLRKVQGQTTMRTVKERLRSRDQNALRPGVAIAEKDGMVRSYLLKYGWTIGAAR